MEELKRKYREGLAPRIKALEALVDAPDGPAPEAVESLRRIAHTLAGSGGTFGFPEITEAARALEYAPDPEIRTRSAALLEVLRKVAGAGTRDPGLVLIIDGDAAAAAHLEQKLARTGRRIVIAGTAIAAQRILAEQSPDLVLLDLVLPDLDGRNLITRIRDEPRTTAIPIIVMTALAREIIRTECAALGVDGFVEKPADPAAVAALVEARLKPEAPAPREAYHDALTGLSNRALFKEWFDRLRALSIRHRQPLALAFLDLDGFKSVNDTYGHAAGDEVLRRLAGMLKGTLRASDLAARWGGEEFVVLLPHTAKAGAVVALEKILEAFRRAPFTTPDGRTFQVTFSAGIVDVGETATLDEAVAQADRFLYLAKAEGRNRIVGARESYAPPKSKVMIADDDPQIASVVQHWLEREGIEVDHFPDGESALAGATKTPYALAILDVQMPGMNGFDLLAKLRSISAYARVPVVMLTAMGSEEHVLRGFQLGADDYVAKPFSPGELHVRVRRLLKRR